MIATQLIAVYAEVVRKPYFVIVHSRLRDDHERFDRYTSKPDGLVEFMLSVVDHLSGGRVQVLEEMCALDEQDKARSSHRTRRYVAKDSEDLYEPVTHRDFQFSTNADKAQAFTVIRLACRAVGVPCESIRKFGAFSQTKR